MADWQWILGPSSGGHDRALTWAKNRKATFRLNAPSDASCQVNGRTEAAAAILELQTDLHLIRGGRELYRGRIGPTSDDLDADNNTVELHSVDYRDVLNRRRLYSDSLLNYTIIDRAQMAWQLVQQTQMRPGGALGITQGITPVLPLATAVFVPGDPVGEKIQALSDVLLPDGFDWDITPASPSALHLDIWSQRGINHGVILEWGSALLAKLHREVDPSTYANGIRLTGSSLTDEVREAADMTLRPEGRWDATFGGDVLTQAALALRADWQLAQAEFIQPIYTLTLTANSWGGPDHIWLGDPVRIIAQDGRLNVDTTLRVHELDVSLDESGTETVALTLGGPRPDYRYKPPQFFRRLVNLERR